MDLKEAQEENRKISLAAAWILPTSIGALGGFMFGPELTPGDSQWAAPDAFMRAVQAAGAGLGFGVVLAIGLTIAIFSRRSVRPETTEPNGTKPRQLAIDGFKSPTGLKNEDAAVGSINE